MLTSIMPPPVAAVPSPTGAACEGSVLMTGEDMAGVAGNLTCPVGTAIDSAAWQGSIEQRPIVTARAKEKNRTLPDFIYAHSFGD